MRVLTLVLVVFTAVPGLVEASGDEQERPRTQALRRSPPDFLFGQPRGSIGVRGSWVFSRTGSDWYEFVTRHLTLEDSDFNAPAIGVDVGFALTPRADLVFGFDFSRSTTSSEYRDFVDNSIFTDVFFATGWTPSAHVFGGVDIRMFRQIFLTLDGRYRWAAGDLGTTWVGFDPIDLTGARMSAGSNVVF